MQRRRSVVGPAHPALPGRPTTAAPVGNWPRPPCRHRKSSPPHGQHIATRRRSTAHASQLAVAARPTHRKLSPPPGPRIARRRRSTAHASQVAAAVRPTHRKSNLAGASAPVILAEGCSDRCSRDQDRKNSLSVSEQHTLCHNEKSNFSYEILIDCTMDGVLSYENV